MIQLSGIFSESLGGTCTIRGYAKYNEIVELSYPHPGYQRPAEDEHVAEISSFITSGSNSFSPEVVLAYTAKYNYYAQGASSEVDALADIRSGKGFTSNVDGIAFKKEKAAGNGFLYTLSIPDKKYDRIEDKPFRRVDGNHRLLAIEKLIAEGQMRSNYLIPFCIIVFPDNVSMKDEKIIFHNINSKAVPIRSERLLEGIIVDSKDELSFSDKELDDSFGHEYLLARKVLKNKPLAIRKLKAIPWIRSDLITALIDIIESIQKRFGNIQTAEHEEAFGIALSNALNDAKLGENGTLLISSGLLFLLVALYYNIEISSPSADAVQYKDRLLTWSEKYQITDAQIDTEQNAASNAECIEAIFNRYVRSTEQTIFMSRCFSAEYNETENAIRRAINEINNEKKTGIMLIRVDEHVKSAYDFLTIVPGQLKTICDTTHPILPIWEREKRNHCFAVRPIYMSNNDYIYSPIIMEEVRKRWIEGFLQFYPPFEIGLERTCTALYAWKNNYEHLFSSEVEVLLKESGCEYAKHDVDLRREDRRGNHPTIDVLGDYDVIGLNTTQKRIFIIECKVLQPIGSVFEHSNQQKRFFTKEKFDEKFQKRIDYFSKVAMSFFANHGYDTEGFTINPYMVVNKVFSSYYKHVQFPIVTFDELKREIQL